MATHTHTLSLFHKTIEIRKSQVPDTNLVEIYEKPFEVSNEFFLSKKSFLKLVSLNFNKFCHVACVCGTDIDLLK